MSIKRHFGGATPSPVNPEDRGIYKWDVEQRTVYVNNLAVPVVIGLRTGLKFTIPSQPTMYSNHFIIRYEINLRGIPRREVERQLAVLQNEIADETLAAVSTYFRAQEHEFDHQIVTVILDFKLTLEALREYGGSVYFHDTDTVVSTESMENVPEHPYSYPGMLETFQERVEEHLPEADVVLELIDNSGRLGPRYYWSLDKVIMLKPKIDLERKDGLYIARRNVVSSVNDVGQSTYEFVPIENINSVESLFGSYERAFNLEQATIQRKEELLAAEHRLTQQRLEFQSQRQEFDERSLKLERENKEAQSALDARHRQLEEIREQDAHRRELERVAVKDHYEVRSHVRKDTSENVKFLPAILIGIGAAALAIKKIWF